MPPLRPSAVSVHNHGNVPRQLVQIQLFQDVRFFRRDRPERMRRRNMECFW
jgi:hypothetical protein